MKKKLTKKHIIEGQVYEAGAEIEIEVLEESIDLTLSEFIDQLSGKEAKVVTIVSLGDTEHQSLLYSVVLEKFKFNGLIDEKGENLWRFGRENSFSVDKYGIRYYARQPNFLIEFFIT